MRKKIKAPVGDVIKDAKKRQGNVLNIHPRVVNLPWPRIFLAVAVIATVAGSLFATKTLSGINKNIASVKEQARPANIKITKITTSQCTDCFNLSDAIGQFRKQNISVSTEKTVSAYSPDGQALIKQFAIKRLPTYIATGETEKNNIQGFIKSNGEVKNKTFIFTKVTPIFIDSVTKKEMGKVTATILTDPSCTQCIDPKLTVENFKKAGVKITDEKEVALNSIDGQALISRYKITKLPTFLFSSDVDLYDLIKTNWGQIGTVENDKTYVARNLSLPYRDIEKNQIVGLVDLIYLSDLSCKDCYDLQKVQRPILTQSFGLKFSSERTVDVNSAEGQNLINQYKITKVPTILLSATADQYPQLKSVWPQVGTVESDGEYVFRQMQQLGSVTYKDLSSNQIINPANKAAVPSQTGQ